jgi:hypothetical protein
MPGGNCAPPEPSNPGWGITKLAGWFAMCLGSTGSGALILVGAHNGPENRAPAAVNHTICESNIRRQTIARLVLPPSEIWGLASTIFR